ncbi:MAG TPA: ABC transporter ATP-binding protein [Gammaproteobacteria bacterium]|nr:ABC transporter ATP-binding protein [Gammaproteobacteria bacterium]
MDVVVLENIVKEYSLGTHKVRALNGINLTVSLGEYLALAGPSGSGKSTLLNLMGCIDSPSEGRVLVDGELVSDKSPDQLADLRGRTIGFIFQTFNLLPVLSAAENVEYPLLNHKDVGKRERRERARYYLKVVGLEQFVDRRPAELSGGQRQRVAIARALAVHPKIVLADEPTANLDHKTGNGILTLMKALNKEYNTTFIFSTHDPKVIEMADRVVRISDGQLVE